MARKVTVVQRKNVIGQRNTNWTVTAHDEQGVTLRPTWVPGNLGSVTLPRDQIASTRKTMGVYWVETTGGRVYKVLPGFRKEHRDMTERALTARPPVQQHPAHLAWYAPSQEQ